MKHSLILLILFLHQYMSAQDNAQLLRFDLTINQQPIALEKNYYYPEINDSVFFESLKFYISTIQFLQNNEEVYVLEKKHFLIDAEKSQTKEIALPKINRAFNKIKFILGVDSLTNVSGAMGQDLDPTNGMYWTWKNGYINFKLEGVSKSCPTRNNRFQYHIGGYQSPYNTSQTIELAVSNTKNIIIGVEIDKFLSGLNLKDTYEVMSPNKKAVELSKVISTIFTVTQ